MEKKKGGDLICRRPETIIEARYKLTKKQNDILDMVFATIENDDKFQYEIDIAKYSQLYNIKDKSNIYRDLKKGVNSFEGKGFSITQKISGKKENRIYFSWFSRIVYLDGESKIFIAIDPMLKELMLNAKKACFYQIKYPINFHNIYSKRIYYYLKTFEDTGWRIDNLDVLRNKLECPKSYDKFADFRKYVLTPAYEEINDNSDIYFEYEIIKTKTKVTGIKFYINQNKARDEIAITPKEIETDPRQDLELIKQVQVIFKENITVLQVKELLDTTKGDINIIKEKYEISKITSDIKNIVGWMLKAIKEDYKVSKGNVKTDTFNDYPQRKYDFSKFESVLSGEENINDVNIYKE